MLHVYYAAAIDNCEDKGKNQLEQFKQLFNKYPVILHGAGIGDSPIIKLNSAPCVKGIIAAHDLKEIRECDILLVVLESKAQAVATFMELEYARQLGLYIIVLILSRKEKICEACIGLRDEDVKKCLHCQGKQKISVADINKSIFLETYVNSIIYSTEALETILKEVTNKEHNE